MTGDWETRRRQTSDIRYQTSDDRHQTSDVRRQPIVSSFRAKREIFVICGQAVDFDAPQNGKTLSPVLWTRHSVYVAALLIYAPHLPR